MITLLLMIGMTVLFFRVLGVLFRMGFGLLGWLFSGSGILAVLVLAVLFGGAFRTVLPLLFMIGMLRVLVRGAGSAC